ncbi:MAG TPA: hypothetical protein VKM94_17975 [Blastocatellia bacterium]|nr:hypothetical protein [Blastocatellia bacterium]
MSANATTLPATTAPGGTATTNVASATKTDWAPTAKVGVGALAAAITTLIIAFWKSATAAEAAAITTLITFAVQYLIPDRK